MRLFIVYDAQGEISTVGTQPDGAPLLSMELEDGQYSAFIDAPHVSTGAGGEEVVAKLHEIRRSYRVTEDAGEVRLAER